MYSSILARIDSCSSLMKVLIIEDEAIIAMDLARMFHSLGAKEVKVVYSAEEGLAWLDEKKPDLVIIDIKLRGSMDGIEAARLIQKRGPFNLVYITAYTDDITLMRARQVPNSGIITKPFTPHEVLELFPRLNF